MDAISYTVIEAARAIGCSRATLYREISDGKLPVRHLRSKTIILAADLKRYVESLPQRSATAA